MGKNRFSYFFVIVMIVIALGLLLIPAEDDQPASVPQTSPTPVGETAAEETPLEEEPLAVPPEIPAPEVPDSEESGDIVEGPTG